MASHSCFRSVRQSISLWVYYPVQNIQRNDRLLCGNLFSCSVHVSFFFLLFTHFFNQSLWQLCWCGKKFYLIWKKMLRIFLIFLQFSNIAVPCYLCSEMIITDIQISKQSSSSGGQLTNCKVAWDYGGVWVSRQEMTCFAPDIPPSLCSSFCTKISWRYWST